MGDEKCDQGVSSTYLASLPNWFELPGLRSRRLSILLLVRLVTRLENDFLVRLHNLLPRYVLVNNRRTTGTDSK